MLVREGSDDERVNLARDILGLERVDFEEKYLGLPTPRGRLKRGIFQPLEERFLKRMGIEGKRIVGRREDRKFSSSSWPKPCQTIS